MKGIILAGGKGTRLYPLTISVSKQILPVYDKPMVFYPMATLMRSQIREVLIISTPEHLPLYQTLFGDGSTLGMKISYKKQDEAGGLPQAFILGEEFIGDGNVCLILGDNIFHGSGVSYNDFKGGAQIFGYHVHDPERYGIVEFDGNNKVLSIEEKPKHPKSNYAVVGLYYYDNNVVEISKNLKPSARGEIEITDVNNYYLKANKLSVKLLDEGTTWFDTGTHDSLLDAAHFIRAVEAKQGTKIACLEEIAYQNGWINKDQLIERISFYGEKTPYGAHLAKICNNK